MGIRDIGAAIADGIRNAFTAVGRVLEWTTKTVWDGTKFVAQRTLEMVERAVALPAMAMQAAASGAYEALPSTQRLRKREAAEARAQDTAKRAMAQQQQNTATQDPDAGAQVSDTVSDSVTCMRLYARKRLQGQHASAELRDELTDVQRQYLDGLTDDELQAFTSAPRSKIRAFVGDTSTRIPGIRSLQDVCNAEPTQPSANDNKPSRDELLETVAAVEAFQQMRLTRPTLH